MDGRVNGFTGLYYLPYPSGISEAEDGKEKLYDKKWDRYRFNDAEQVEEPSTKLTGRNLQVITKIVQINFNEPNELAGAWHVEGMSHENIVATATCTLEQDPGLSAELLFKRVLTGQEADYYQMKISQYPHDFIYEILEKATIPLGRVEINTGTCLVFPNSHIHKLDMKSVGPGPQTRTLVVFWLINPDVKIPSTSDIPQQNWDREVINANRLELMKERSLYKNTFNIRELNLCEH